MCLHECLSGVLRMPYRQYRSAYLQQERDGIQGAPVPVNVSLLDTSNASVESWSQISKLTTPTQLLRSERDLRQSAISRFCKFRSCEVCVLLSVPKFQRTFQIIQNVSPILWLTLDCKSGTPYRYVLSR